MLYCQEVQETLHAWRTVTRDVTEVAEERHFLDWMTFGPIRHPRPAYIWDVEMVREAGSKRDDAQVNYKQAYWLPHRLYCIDQDLARRL